MIESQAMKRVLLIAPTSVTAGGTATGYVDTAGWDYADIDLYLSAGSTTHTNAFTSVTVSEGDSTGSFSTFQGCQQGTDYTLPATTGTTAPTGAYFGASLDLRQRKRYLKLSATPATGTHTVAAIATLSRGQIAPASYSERGRASEVIV